MQDRQTKEVRKEMLTVRIRKTVSRSRIEPQLLSEPRFQVERSPDLAEISAEHVLRHDDILTVVYVHRILSTMFPNPTSHEKVLFSHKFPTTDTNLVASLPDVHFPKVI